ncbi:MAG: S8 family serine peptidase [Candidatus Thorarchaeota archaeon]
MATNEPSQMIPVVVRFDDEASKDEMTEILTGMRAEGLKIRHVFHLIPFASLYASAAAVSELISNWRVKYIDIDRRVSISETDLRKVGPAELGSTSYDPPHVLLGAEQMWTLGYNGSGVTIAIIDTGVQPDHPDLQGRVVAFKDLVGDRTLPYDDNGHGTACAWLAAGTGQAMGRVLSGTAPGARIMAVKVLDSEGSGEDSVIAQGIEYAVDNGADVISLSLGGPWSDTYNDPTVAAADAAVRAGVVVVAAAGNAGPAAATVNSPGVSELSICVGASMGSFGVASFSGRGPVVRTVTPPIGVSARPDLIAPGYRVVSGRSTTANMAEYPLYNQTQYGYLYTVWSGTSVSTPLVAGLAALLVERHTGISPLGVKVFLMAGASDLGEDPMAQGHGIANVSRASELLLSSSGAFSVVSPTRYPTIPGGQNVVIVGDEREDQLLTVISTVNVRDAVIGVEGNASRLVTVPVGPVDIIAGYNYVEIGLRVPRNTTLDEIGSYTGVIRFTHENVTVVSVDLSIRLRTFGGRVIVDQSHQSSEDPDDLKDYRYFGDYLRELGMRMEPFTGESSSGSITSDSLSLADVLLIMDTELEYSDSEIRAIHEFVNMGGTLLMFSEYYSESENKAYFSMESYNRILAPYGIQCETREIGLTPEGSGMVYGADYGGAVETHPLVEGVRNLYVNAGSTLSVDSSVPGTQGLLWTDATRQHAIVAIAQSGKGRVVVISDGSTMYDENLFYATIRGADNVRLLQNLASFVRPAWPILYGITIGRGGLERPANVTAYVFDDDLSNVTITVERGGVIIASGLAEEELGYKFVKTFDQTARGFVVIELRATDDMGNIRVFRRIALLTAELVDPVVLAQVVAALLGVLAVSLGYVAVLKMRGRPRHEPQNEAEWEVPIDDRPRPPEIE